MKTTLKNRPLPDYCKKTLAIVSRSFERRGYITEKEKRLLLKTWSWLVGFPVTEAHLKELERIL